MSSLPVPPVPDLARVGGSTVDEAYAWFLAYYDRDPVPWNRPSSMRRLISVLDKQVRSTASVQDANRLVIRTLLSERPDARWG